MKGKPCRHASKIVAASICLIGLDATGRAPKVPPELVGTWSYATMSPLKNGQPYGVVHFQPGQWTVMNQHRFAFMEERVARLNKTCLLEV